MKKVVVIPARLNSTRLPNKVLLDLKGKTVVQRVYEQCLKTNCIDEVYIATDSTEIKQSCESFTNNIILTKSNHQSGTDRIAEAIMNIDCDIVINVQGDEPFINPILVEKLANSFESNTVMISAMCRINDEKELQNPNVVKVVMDYQDNALYFSRSAIPCTRDSQEKLCKSARSSHYKFFKHIGIYAYKKEFLLKLSKMKPTPLEHIEKLEQLRAIENGYRIKMIETDFQSIGIDTQEDYKNALELLS